MYPSTSSGLDLSLQQLETVLRTVDQNARYEDPIYFLFPASLTKNFTQHQRLKELNVKYSFEHFIRFHISTEALPKVDLVSFFMLKFVKDVGLNIVVLKSGKYAKKINDTDAGFFSGNDDPTIEELYAKCRYSIF